MLAILADDPTGALDSAAPFAGRGLHTEVVLQPDAILAALQEKPAVLSVNVGSRDLDEQGAKRETEHVLSLLPEGTVLFKKVDSRLKGHISAELDVTPYRSALVAPAIPDFGRILKSGHLEGFGVETPISVSERLGRHAARCIVPDIGDQVEMLAALKAAQASGCDLLVGARGLADALARQMTDGKELRQAEVPQGPALFVIGSRDPITLAQVERLRQAHDIRSYTAENGELAQSGKDDLADRAIVLVQATSGASPRTSAEVSKNLAENVHPRFTQHARTLLMSGGATAEAVLAKMGISRFRLAGECLPGLGIAYSQNYCIIAKSGGFGQSETLVDVANMILRKMG
jgi:uncharacterized protein YgbK (DUF1537 family)